MWIVSYGILNDVFSAFYTSKLTSNVPESGHLLKFSLSCVTIMYTSNELG